MFADNKKLGLKFGQTFLSQEKVPFLIDIAGRPDCRGGFSCSFLSSARKRSSSLFRDTLALTTCIQKPSSVNDLIYKCIRKHLTQE